MDLDLSRTDDADGLQIFGPENRSEIRPARRHWRHHGSDRPGGSDFACRSDGNHGRPLGGSSSGSPEGVIQSPYFPSRRQTPKSSPDRPRSPCPRGIRGAVSDLNLIIRMSIQTGRSAFPWMTIPFPAGEFKHGRKPSSEIAAGEPADGKGLDSDALDLGSGRSPGDQGPGQGEVIKVTTYEDSSRRWFYLSPDQRRWPSPGRDRRPRIHILPWGC